MVKDKVCKFSSRKKRKLKRKIRLLSIWQPNSSTTVTTMIRLTANTRIGKIELLKDII